MKIPLPALLGLIAAAASILFLGLKALQASGAVKAAKKAAESPEYIAARAKENRIPDFSRKYIYSLLDPENSDGSRTDEKGLREKLAEELQSKCFLHYAEGDRSNRFDLPREVKAEAPDLILLNLSTRHSIEDNLNLIEDIKKKYSSANYALLADPAMRDSLPQLEALTGEGKIKTYVFSDLPTEEIFIRLILPLYRHLIFAEAGKENAEKISEKLGLSCKTDSSLNAIADVMGWNTK